MICVAVSYVNATMYRWVLVLGHFFDVNDYQTYHLSKVFDQAYIDVLVTGLISFFMVFILNAVFDFLTYLLNLIFGNQFFRSKPTVSKIIHWTIILLSIALGFISITQHFYLATAIILLLTMIDISIRSSTYNQKALVHQPLIPVIFYLMLFVDKYVIEGAWRLSYNMKYISIHYQEGAGQT